MPFINELLVISAAAFDSKSLTEKLGPISVEDGGGTEITVECSNANSSLKGGRGVDEAVGGDGGKENDKEEDINMGESSFIVQRCS